VRFARTGIREGVVFFLSGNSLFVASYFGITIPLSKEVDAFSNSSILSKKRRSGDFEFGRENISSSSEKSDESPEKKLS